MSKHRKYLCLAAATVVMVIVILACALQTEQRAAAPFDLRISAGGADEVISLWEEDGAYYAFLPGYADFSEVRIKLNTSVPVYVDGKAITDGMSCEMFRTGEVYELAYRAWGRERLRVLIN